MADELDDDERAELERYRKAIAWSRSQRQADSVTYSRQYVDDLVERLSRAYLDALAGFLWAGGLGWAMATTGYDTGTPWPGLGLMAVGASVVVGSRLGRVLRAIPKERIERAGSWAQLVVPLLTAVAILAAAMID